MPEFAQTDKENLEARWHELKFNIDRSARYNCRRGNFLSWMHLILNSLTVFMAVTALMSLLNEEPAVWPAAAIIALLFVSDAWDCARTSGMHNIIMARFLEMAMTMERAPCNEATLDELTTRRHVIELNEPRAMIILNTICWNETARAIGCPESSLVKLSLIQRLLAQFCDIGADKVGQK